jgi:hypothetical protein
VKRAICVSLLYNYTAKDISVFSAGSQESGHRKLRDNISTMLRSHVIHGNENVVHVELRVAVDESWN